MKPLKPCWWALLAMALACVVTSPAVAEHDFVEEFEAAGNALADAAEINQEVVLEGFPGRFSRQDLAGTAFLAEPLPVSSSDLTAGGAPDKELLWEVAFGDDETLALTLDDAAGNYPFRGVRVETFLAAVGDVESGAYGGAVARHSQNQFYAAYGAVMSTESGLKIHFELQKRQFAGFRAFSPLDEYIGPAASAPFDFAKGENFQVRLEVTAPDEEGISQVCAHFHRVIAGEAGLIQRRLATLVGRDGSLNTGRVGVYAASGSVGSAVQIAFDSVRTTVIEGLSLPCLLGELEGVIEGLDVDPQAGDLTGPKERVNLRFKTILLQHAAQAIARMDANDLEGMSRALEFIRRRSAGRGQPADWVAGPAAARIVALIDEAVGQT